MHLALEYLDQIHLCAINMDTVLAQISVYVSVIIQESNANIQFALVKIQQMNNVPGSEHALHQITVHVHLVI